MGLDVPFVFNDRDNRQDPNTAVVGRNGGRGAVGIAPKPHSEDRFPWDPPVEPFSKSRQNLRALVVKWNKRKTRVRSAALCATGSRLNGREFLPGAAAEGISKVLCLDFYTVARSSSRVLLPLQVPVEPCKIRWGEQDQPVFKLGAANDGKALLRSVSATQHPSSSSAEKTKNLRSWHAPMFGCVCVVSERLEQGAAGAPVVANAPMFGADVKRK